MKHLYLFLALCITPILAQAQFNFYVSSVSVQGQPVYNTVSPSLTYIDKVDVSLNAVQVFPSSGNPNKSYKVIVYRATDNRFTGVGACDPASTQKTQIGSYIFSSTSRNFQRNVTIDIQDQIYSCANCRIENYSIRIEVIGLSPVGNETHVVAGNNRACGRYTDSLWQ